MNKRLLYLSLFLLLTASFGSRAQEYIPMLKEGNQWNVLTINRNTNWIRTQIITLADEVEIDGIEYVEVKRSGYEDPDEIKTIGYLREDVKTHKVYYRGVDDLEEGLLYDFDVEEGDTLITILPGFSGSVDPNIKSFNIITSVDHVVLNGIERRRISLDANTAYWGDETGEWHKSENELPQQATYIEGIGSLEGLLTEFIHLPGFYIGPLLVFKQSDGWAYNPHNYEKEFYWDEEPSYASIEQLGDELPIHITLSSDQLFIRNDQEAEYDIALYTPTGRLILTQQSGGREAIVNLSSLPAGVYFLRVSGEGDEVTKKIRVVK